MRSKNKISIVKMKDNVKNGGGVGIYDFIILWAINLALQFVTSLMVFER